MKDAADVTPTLTTCFIEKLRCRSLQVGVLGLGQCGLPIAMCIAKAGFSVTGIDIDGRRVEIINTGSVADETVTADLLTTLVNSRRLRATQSMMALEPLDAITVCVPTSTVGQPDAGLSYLLAATEALRIHLHLGQLIVINSDVSSHIAATVVLPILHRSGLRVGVDFFLAQRLGRGIPGPCPASHEASAINIVGMTTQCQELATLYCHYICSPSATIT